MVTDDRMKLVSSSYIFPNEPSGFSRPVILFRSLHLFFYEAYVKSKFRYKIYLAMNEVTSMLYVSVVRQFETLLFYIVTSRIQALVSRDKFLNACVEKSLSPVVFWNPSGTEFPKMQIFSHNPVYSFP